MAKITLHMTAPGMGQAQKDVNIEDADCADIMAAFTAAIPAITNADQLLAFFASGIAEQIKGTTQDYRTKKTPQPAPPVTIS